MDDIEQTRTKSSVSRTSCREGSISIGPGEAEVFPVVDHNSFRHQACQEQGVNIKDLQLKFFLVI